MYDSSTRPQYSIFCDASSEESRDAVKNADPETVRKLKEAGIENGRDCRLGWCCFNDLVFKRTRDLKKACFEAGFYDIPQSLIAFWKKKQPIALAETLGGFAGLFFGLANMRGADVKLFIDNTCVVDSLIKGSSKEDNLDSLVHCLHVWAAAFDVRLWLTWVPTANNPADEPSRDATLFGMPVPRMDLPEFMLAEDMPAKVFDILYLLFLLLPSYSLSIYDRFFFILCLYFSLRKRERSLKRREKEVESERAVARSFRSIFDHA
jgi:hypothetical protein